MARGPVKTPVWGSAPYMAIPFSFSSWRYTTARSQALGKGPNEVSRSCLRDTPVVGAVSGW